MNVPYNFEIVIRDKKGNSEGLQIADLMPRPIGLSILRSDQPNRAFEVLKEKLFAPGGVMSGHGLKISSLESERPQGSPWGLAPAA